MALAQCSLSFHCFNALQRLANMPSSRPNRLPQLTDVLAWIARSLVLILLLVAPWPYAMAEWSSQVWLVPIVGAILLLAALVAILRRQSVGNPLVWSLAAILAMGILQVVPLPESLWKMLAPAAGFDQKIEQLAIGFAKHSDAVETTAASQNDAGNVPQDEAAEGDSEAVGEAERSESPQAPDRHSGETQRGELVEQGSRTLSIDPLQTRATMCVFAMGLAVLLSCIVLFRDRWSVSLLLGSLTLSGLAISLLGIYQAVKAGDWTLIDVPKQSSFATFYSRNSAPQFLACCFAATVGLLGLYRANKNKSNLDKRYRVVYPSVNIVARLRRRIEEFITDADPLSFGMLIAMVLLFASVLIANSRGGILAFLASGLAVLLIYGLGRQASFGSIVAVGLLVVGSGLFLSLYGLDELVGARMDTVSREAYQMDNARLELWKMALSQPSAWLLGSGLGTFHFAVLPAYPTPQTAWFYHAENIYIELASDAGMVTLLIGMAGLLWLIWQLLSQPSQSNTSRATRLACLFGVLAVALQNLVDFSLMLPAVFLPLACLIGAYLGTRHQVRQKVRRMRASQSSSASSTTQRRRPSDLHLNENATEDLESAKLPGAASTTDDRERYAHQRRRHSHGRSGGGHLASSTSLAGSTEAPLSNAPRLSATSEPHWDPRTWIVCLLLISAAVGLGYRPLASFAFAEQLQASQQPDSDLVELIRSATKSQWATFPESRLQIGRWRQELARKQLLDSPRWPDEVSPAMRQSLSSPEFFNTAFHATTDPQLNILREFLDQEPSVLKNLSDSKADMRAALSACPLDWRASWGLLRSDLGDETTEQRGRNYARILLTCRNNQAVLQASGTHALMIGDTAAGLELWRQLLPVSSRARSQILNLVDRFLTTEQLVDILPENPLQRIELARRASSLSAPEVADAILSAIDLDRAFDAARFAADWPQVAWCAAQKGVIAREIEAWEQAILDDAYNPKLVYDLALALQRAERPKEALRRAEEALSRSPDNVQYQSLVQSLKNEIDPK